MSGPPQNGYPPQPSWGGQNPQRPDQQPTQAAQPRIIPGQVVPPGQAQPSQPLNQPQPGPGQQQGQQPPPPYRPPAQPQGQQHMYGYPPPRPVPPPNPSPPLRSRRKRVVLLVAAAVVVVALLAGGAVWYLNRGGKDDTAKKKHDTKGQVDWQAPVPKFSGDKAAVPGTWFTGKVVAKTEISSVTGYKLNGGAKAWSIPLPGPVCAAATDASGGRTALMYRTGDSCTHLMGIDLDAGKLLWNRVLPKSRYRDGKPIKEAQIAVSANIAAVTWGEGTKGFRLSDGVPRWGRTSGDYCSSVGFVGGKKLLEVNWCKEQAKSGKDKKKDAAKANSDQKLVYYVRGRGPVTGNALWKWEAPDGVEVQSVLSTDPIVLGTSNGDSVGPTDLITLNRRGEPGVEISLGKNSDPSATNHTAYNTGCFLSLESCVNVLVTKNTVYLGANGRDAAAGTPGANEVVAFDLSTGAQRWHKAPDPQRGGLPVGTVGSDPVVYLPATGKQGGRLLLFDAKTGKSSLYQQNPDSGGTQESQYASARKYLHGGRLFLVNETLDDSTDKLITAYR